MMVLREMAEWPDASTADSGLERRVRVNARFDGFRPGFTTRNDDYSCNAWTFCFFWRCTSSATNLRKAGLSPPYVYGADGGVLRVGCEAKSVVREAFSRRRGRAGLAREFGDAARDFDGLRVGLVALRR